MTAMDHGSVRVVAIIIGCLLVGLALVGWFVVVPLLGKPTIATDYAAEYNKVTTPPDYDPNLNAGPHYERVFAAFTPLPEALSAGVQKGLWPADFNDADRATIGQWVVANEEAVRNFGIAAQCPYWWRECRSPDGLLIHASVLDMAKHREWIFAALMLARHEASQGRVAGALQMATDLHAMGTQTVSGNITLLEQLVGLAICQRGYDTTLAIIARYPTDTGTLERTLQVFKARIPRARVPRFTEGEFLFQMDWVQRVFTDDGHGNGRLLPRELCRMAEMLAPMAKPLSLAGAVRVCLNHPNRRRTVEISRDFYDAANALTAKTPRQMSNERSTYETQLRRLEKGVYSPADDIVSFGRIIELGWRGQVSAQGMMAALAALTYKTKEGHLPESLEKLVTAGLLPQVPLDPYSNGPLVYKVRGDDFLLYSVGPDMVDNGGVHSTWDEKTGDHVFWPPQKR